MDIPKSLIIEDHPLSGFVISRIRERNSTDVTDLAYALCGSNVHGTIAGKNLSACYKAIATHVLTSMEYQGVLKRDAFRAYVLSDAT